MQKRFLRLGVEFLLFRKIASKLDPACDHAINFLLWTGTREECVESMEWSEVSADLKMWTIPASRTLRGMPCIVPLMKPAIEILKARLNASENRRWVFPSDITESGHIESLSRRWRRVSKNAGLPQTKALSSSVAGWLDADLVDISDLRVAVASYAKS